MKLSMEEIDRTQPQVQKKVFQNQQHPTKEEKRNLPQRQNARSSPVQPTKLRRGKPILATTSKLENLSQTKTYFGLVEE
jgi:hypothetical protein